MNDWRLHLAMNPSEPWPVRLILDGAEWQRGYDLAMGLADNQTPNDIANPFDPNRDAFYGFEGGRLDAEKLRRLANEEVSTGGKKS